VAADILASNGIIHVINGVLLPEEATASVVMRASLVGARDQSTLAKMASEEKSSSGYRNSVDFVIFILASVGVLVYINL